MKRLILATTVLVVVLLSPFTAFAAGSPGSDFQAHKVIKIQKGKDASANTGCPGSDF